MSSDYTDEDLYMHYRQRAASDAEADVLVTEHRRRFPSPPARDVADWEGLPRAEVAAGILYAVQRAAGLGAGAERTAQLAHAMTGAVALAEVTPKRTKR